MPRASPRHGEGFLERISLCVASGEIGERNGITARFNLGVEYSGVSRFQHEKNSFLKRYFSPASRRIAFRMPGFKSVWCKGRIIILLISSCRRI